MCLGWYSDPLRYTDPTGHAIVISAGRIVSTLLPTPQPQQSQPSQPQGSGGGNTVVTDVAKATYNFVIGDDISTLQNPNAGAVEKGFILASNAPQIKGPKLGIKILGVTGHGVTRMIERGISPSAILDAVRNPLKVESVIIDSLGRPSQRYIGEVAEIVLNPETLELVSGNRTSTKKVIKLLKELGEE